MEKAKGIAIAKARINQKEPNQFPTAVATSANEYVSVTVGIVGVMFNYLFQILVFIRRRRL
jgi:hypothetical protein